MQVWVHPVDLAAPGNEAHGGALGGAAAATADRAGAPWTGLASAAAAAAGDDGGAAPRPRQRDVLVLAAAHGLVGAVLLRPFDLCVDMHVAGASGASVRQRGGARCARLEDGRGVARARNGAARPRVPFAPPRAAVACSGQLEGVAAAEWLQQVHAHLGFDLATSLRASTPLSTYSPAALPALAAHWAAAARHAGLAAAAAAAAAPQLRTHGSFVPAAATTTTAGRRRQREGSGDGGAPADGSPQVPDSPAGRAAAATRANPITGSPLGKSMTLARMLLQRAGSSRHTGSSTRSPRGPAAAPLHPSGSSGQASSSLPPLASRTVSAPTHDPHHAGRSAASPHTPGSAAAAAATDWAGGSSPGTPGAPPDLLSPFAAAATALQPLLVPHVAAPPPLDVAAPPSPASPPLPSALSTAPSAAGGGLSASPLGPAAAAAAAGALPAGSVALVLDHAARRLLVVLDKLPAGSSALLAAAWPVLAACHARLRAAGGGGGGVLVPPKHSRLCLTLGQLERLAALRAPPEAGLRLGHADSAPWHLHPELAPVAAMEEVRREAPPCGALGRASMCFFMLAWCMLLRQGANDGEADRGMSRSNKADEPVARTGAKMCCPRLACRLQVVLQVPLPAHLAAGGPAAPGAAAWFVSGQRDAASSCEVLVLHRGDVNEVVVQQQARLLLEQHRVD